MDGCRETNIMWKRHNDSDTEIMKKREGVLHGKEGKKTRIPGKIDNRFLSSLLSAPSPLHFFIAGIESLQSIVLHSVT